MRIEVHVLLFPPGDYISYGGKNFFICEKTFRVKLSPGKLKQIMKGRIKTPFEKNLYSITGYDDEENRLNAEGYLDSFEKDYLKKMQDKGWIFSKKGVEHHGIEI